ncbi:hypothetical protein BDQ17DRAFT_544876 [Cyathus striatus]|nr:hypothetical protein BDQ17DRAFT_544876 [Cyathus striatus]
MIVVWSGMYRREISTAEDIELRPRHRNAVYNGVEEAAGWWECEPSREKSDQVVLCRGVDRPSSVEMVRRGGRLEKERVEYDRYKPDTSFRWPASTIYPCYNFKFVFFLSEIVNQWAELRTWRIPEQSSSSAPFLLLTFILSTTD